MLPPLEEISPVPMPAMILEGHKREAAVVCDDESDDPLLVHSKSSSIIDVDINKLVKDKQDESKISCPVIGLGEETNDDHDGFHSSSSLNRVLSFVEWEEDCDKTHEFLPPSSSSKEATYPSKSLLEEALEEKEGIQLFTQDVNSNEPVHVLYKEVLPKSILTTSSAAQINKTKHHKRVKFESLHIRTFHRILGDHPCCQSGLPLTFSWKHIHEQTIELEHYETARCPRRNRQDMKLKDLDRRNILSADSLLDRSTHANGARSSGGSSSSSSTNNENAMNESVDESLVSIYHHHDGLLNTVALKQAERKFYRSRGRRKTRELAKKFFTTPVE